jgi:sialate O-acetylesterase
MKTPIAVLLILLGSSAIGSGAVRLPGLISSHMVLQRGAPVRIWGWAQPNESVTVTFAGQSVSRPADANGHWEVFLKPMERGGPAALTVTGNNKLTLEDVVVGEVWVASGQSNMAFALRQADNAAQAISQANLPLLRLFNVPHVIAEETPMEDAPGTWASASPETAGTWPAVAFYFGRDILRTQNVPVGIINASYSGTPAQAWTSHGALAGDASLKWVFDRWKEALERYSPAMDQYEKEWAEYQKRAAELRAKGMPAPDRPWPPIGKGHSNTPSVLFNGMIAPLTPFTIRGVIWYQGEQNGNADTFAYRTLFRTMIEDWRAAWGIGPFPFYFVQLPACEAGGLWPLLRESQAEALSLRNTGMAVTIDLGDLKNPRNVHPTNKQPVGERLALIARARTYGERIVDSGPVVRQVVNEGERLRVWFEQTGSGLEARGAGPLTGFAVAGKDGRFVTAQAAIDGDTVVVSAPAVAHPLFVRYAWADYPAANLTNRELLPAAPFRSDR